MEVLRTTSSPTRLRDATPDYSQSHREALLLRVRACPVHGGGADRGPDPAPSERASRLLGLWVEVFGHLAAPLVACTILVARTSLFFSTLGVGGLAAAVTSRMSLPLAAWPILCWIDARGLPLREHAAFAALAMALALLVASALALAHGRIHQRG